MKKKRSNRTSLVGALVGIGLLLAGCELFDTGDAPFESISFKYVYALPDANGGYAIVAPNGDTCQNVPLPVSLPQLAAVVQNQSDFYDDMANCGGTFLVAGNAVKQVRDNGLFFRYQVTGSNNDALIQADRLTIDNSVVDPSGISITTYGGLTVGALTTLGFADVPYTTPPKSFHGENGGPVWSQNTNRQAPTFFEMKLTRQTNKVAEGVFQSITRNQTDTTDARLLLVLDGAFSMAVR